MTNTENRTIVIDGNTYRAGDSLFTHWVDADGHQVTDWKLADAIDAAFLARRRAAQS